MVGPERDLIGYGPTPPKVVWPNGARIAVSVVVNYEEGSEYSLLDGDLHHETNSEVASPVPPTERDLANESFFQYGSRAGVWRILRTLDMFGIPATFYCCALALERNPLVGPEIVRRGHEVFGHGYRWEEYFRMDREQEREAIRDTVESLIRTTGQRPLAGMFAMGPVSILGNWSLTRAASSMTVAPTTTTCPTTPRWAVVTGWWSRTLLRSTTPSSGGGA